MKWEIILAGFGGQGIMLLGQLLAYGAMEENKNTTWFPSYGPEMRGGTANCSVVISTKPVSSPIISRPDILVAMNYPSLTKFQDKVKKEGFLFVNSSLVNSDSYRQDVKVIKIPANDLAIEIGSAKIANMVMLGAIIEKTKCLNPENLVKILKKKMPSIKDELLELNKRAIEKGRNFVN